MHRTGGVDVAWHRPAVEDVADGVQSLLLRLVQEWRHFLQVAHYRQEALAALRQAAEFTAVVGGLRHCVAQAAQQAVDLIQQVPVAGGQARDVLEHDQRNRVISQGFAHQPDAAQCPLVQSLVLRETGSSFGLQAFAVLALGVDEDGVVGAQRTSLGVASRPVRHLHRSGQLPEGHQCVSGGVDAEEWCGLELSQCR